MATTSPTPSGSSQLPVATRKASLRSGLRRGSARPQLSRAESNPMPASNAPQMEYAGHESSDDEIPVPMKLSALTKALLNDGGAEGEKDYGRVRTRAQHRASSPLQSVPEQEKPAKRRSVLNTSVNSNAEERRHTRASSAQVSSRPTSPVRSQASESSPVRKRVVRLSAQPQGNAVASSSQIQPSKRRSVSLATSNSKIRPSSRTESVAPEDKANESEIKDNSLNTPAQQGRVVRIAVGSSGGRSRSTGSSAVSTVSSSKRADSASNRSHLSQPDDHDAPEEPQTIPRQQGESIIGSVSRQGSQGSRSKNDENQANHGSMRIKRVGKIPGSFLSGPARRGRTRQSGEDAGNEGDYLPSGQEQDGQHPPENIGPDPLDNLASSYYVPDHLSSGSPVSAKASARAGHKMESSMIERPLEMRSRQKSPDHGDEILIPHYKVPPPRPDMPSRHDQENEAPPTFKKSKPLGVLSEKDIAQASARPLSADVRAGSPERKALAPLNQNKNTPHRAAPAPPPKMSILDAATSNAGAATAQATRRRNYLKVNGKHYTRIDALGRGGSGKVYRVSADNGKMFALKRVSIEGADESTVKGYKGEIDLLKKLTNVDRVVTLFDYEMNEEKQVLSLLMEMGELDLNTLLRMRLTPEGAKFDPVFVRYYWQEMLECLQSVHAYDIVHSDLKPANFVLVQGRLKLIDFGIANAIQTDETVNVHRETQIGTPNYMSPESLLDSNADASSRRISTNPTRPKLMKLGKPSDIWSLGCILFQMVYGTPPFGHIPNQMARCHAIINWNYDIEFKDKGIGGVPVPPSLQRTMKRCLQRDQHLRPTCAELLGSTDPFLYPVETPDGNLPITEELLGRIVQSVVMRCRDRLPTENEVLSTWPQAYWSSVAKAVGKDLNMRSSVSSSSAPSHGR
ncbi:kinase-like protein [Xylariaceae sp. FL0016]|nr:kinase-like protein [Xylariaceae sp. FL0016]